MLYKMLKTRELQVIIHGWLKYKLFITSISNDFHTTKLFVYINYYPYVIENSDDLNLSMKYFRRMIILTNSILRGPLSHSKK